MGSKLNLAAMAAGILGIPPITAPAFKAALEQEPEPVDELHLTDRELVELLVETFGMTPDEADERLLAYWQ